MAEEFLESKPDPLFPCHTEAALRARMQIAMKRYHVHEIFWSSGTCAGKNSIQQDARAWESACAQNLSLDERQLKGDIYEIASNERDALGRCSLKCANCNCRMLFNQLECVKADLETTKETLNITSVNLDDTMVELCETRIALEECKKERNEEKRKFSVAIATMVQSEMSDVRTQLTALNLCLKDELGEKSLAKAATSEAAKAALSASKFIKLRLLMF